MLLAHTIGGLGKAFLMNPAIDISATLFPESSLKYLSITNFSLSYTIILRYFFNS